MKDKTIWSARWHKAIAEVPQDKWDRLAIPLQTPLLEWNWLYHLEASGSITPQAGWHPCHLTIWRGEQLVAAAPLYIKTHSHGEFVFDHWWARWAKDLGVAYYPKLVGMSPVTPSVGYRFLIAPEEDQTAVIKAMFATIDRLCEQLDLSGCHLLFVDPLWRAGLDANGYVPWKHQSFLWRNPGYATFDDYLKPFKSSQRRNIRREQSYMAKMDLEIRTLTGDQISEDMAAVMYAYYQKTNEQFGPWGCKYLTADFFERVFRQCRHRLLLMAAYERTSDKVPLALSMLLTKNRHLIGRYWGCARQIKHLHFNMCYYMPIQWAIEHGIETFDPGAGSPHKIYRGFKAVANTSWHRFYEPRIRTLFLRFINEVNQGEQANIDELNAQLPFASDAENRIAKPAPIGS